jgi:hypothetical protein
MTASSRKSRVPRNLIRETTVLLVLVGLAGARGSLELGKVYETWEVSSNQFTVRVKAFEEHSQALGGAYFLYEAASRDTDHWQQIMGFRHDDPIKIPHDNVRFVSDKIGYVFLGWKFAVTNDGSQTWSGWNAETDLSNWNCCNYGLIRDVTLSVQGRGKMTLHPIQGRNEPAVLMTEDYGKHWHR